MHRQSELAELQAKLSQATKQGTLTWTEASNVYRDAALRNIELSDALALVSDKLGENTQVATTAAPVWGEVNVALYGTAAASLAARDAIVEHRLAQENALPIYQLALAALHDSNIALEEQRQHEDAIRLAAGLVTEEQIKQRDAVEQLTLMLERGQLTDDEYTRTLQAVADGATSAGDAVLTLAENILKVQDRDVTIKVNYVTTGGPAPYGAEPGPGAPVNIPDTGGGGTNDQRQHGTGGEFVMVPPGFPNDSYRLGLSSFERYAVVPAGVTNNNNNMSNTWNFHGVSPDVVQRIVERELARVGETADARRRTR
jgi:hypothetical protein